MELEARLAKIEDLLTLLVKQEKQKTELLRNVFETLDSRLVNIENGIVTTAGDASQARTNTHQIRNYLQRISGTLVLIQERLGISNEEIDVYAAQELVHATPR